eukprot:TRINITY_DN929_c0_g3_i1.p1 TRINITY_DN929_c0_g3~~TRINITY_DN929_c0_g3_i1.p1  ORF type:complete len:741 (+),score=138.57 TRINITY_DN929_c0_g3_i1:50-2224(+)
MASAATSGAAPLEPPPLPRFRPSKYTEDDAAYAAAKAELRGSSFGGGVGFPPFQGFWEDAAAELDMSVVHPPRMTIENKAGFAPAELEVNSFVFRAFVNAWRAQYPWRVEVRYRNGAEAAAPAAAGSKNKLRRIKAAFSAKAQPAAGAGLPPPSVLFGATADFVEALRAFDTGRSTLQRFPVTHADMLVVDAYEYYSPLPSSASKLHSKQCTAPALRAVFLLRSQWDAFVSLQKDKWREENARREAGRATPSPPSPSPHAASSPTASARHSPGPAAPSPQFGSPSGSVGSFRSPTFSSGQFGSPASVTGAPRTPFQLHGPHGTGSAGASSQQGSPTCFSNGSLTSFALGSGRARPPGPASISAREAHERRAGTLPSPQAPQAGSPARLSPAAAALQGPLPVLESVKSLEELPVDSIQAVPVAATRRSPAEGGSPRQRVSRRAQFGAQAAPLAQTLTQSAVMERPRRGDGVALPHSRSLPDMVEDRPSSQRARAMRGSSSSLVDLVQKDEGRSVERASERQEAVACSRKDSVGRSTHTALSSCKSPAESALHSFRDPAAAPRGAPPPDSASSVLSSLRSACDGAPSTPDVPDHAHALGTPGGSRRGASSAVPAAQPPPLALTPKVAVHAVPAAPEAVVTSNAYLQTLRVRQSSSAGSSPTPGTGPASPTAASAMEQPVDVAAAGAQPEDEAAASVAGGGTPRGRLSGFGRAVRGLFQKRNVKVSI